MKYIHIFILGLFSLTILSQATFQDAYLSGNIFEFQGDITNSVKNQLIVPPGQIWLIYNSSSNHFEYATDNQNWRIFNESSTSDYFFIPQSISELSDPNNAHKLAVITINFNLGGGSLTLSEGLELRAAGGIFYNGTIVGNNSSIDGRVEAQLFDPAVDFSGTWQEAVWFKPEWYGAINMPDDFLALKSTFENWDQIHLVGDYEFNTDGQIFLDGPSRIVRIKGDGKIENNSSTHINQPMFVVRDVARLEIDRLKIDGKFKANCGLYLKDCQDYVIHNLDIQNFLNSGTGFNRAVGVRLDINKRTILKGDNWILKEFNGGADGTINSGSGVSRCFWILINYDGLPEDDGTVVEITNSKFHWAYGDDGDILDVADQDYVEFPKHRFIFRNTEFKYFSRRASKGSAGGIQYYNCTFDTADEATLTSKMGGTAPQPSGYLNVRNASEATAPNFRNSYGAIVNCTFNDTGNLTIGSGNRVIVQNVNGVLFDSNVFNGVDIVLSKNISGCIIENNQFNNSFISIWAGINWESDRSSICYNRMNLDVNASGIGGFINSDGNIHNVNICHNNIWTDETNLSLFLGLIRQLGGTGSNVDLLNNRLIRTNNQRTEIMHSLVNWDATCRIEDNKCNLNSGLGIYFNGGTNAASTNNNSYNMTGGMLPSRAIFNQN